MALTPEDVVNKRFQPTKFREGYDQDEVDDFLDEIVVELRRLNQENEELRRQVAAGTSTAGSSNAASSTTTPSGEVSQAATVPGPVSASTSAASTSTAGVKKSGAGADADPGTDVDAVAGKGQVAAETQAPEPTAAGGATPAGEVQAAPQTSSTTSVESAAGVLAMAQRLHDEYVNAGVEQRDKIIAEAQIEADGLVSDAEEKSRKTLGDLEQEKSVLERKVEQLRGFERDYRTRLKAYIEGQLRDLDARGPIASDSSTS